MYTANKSARPVIDYSSPWSPDYRPALMSRVHAFDDVRIFVQLRHCLIRCFYALESPLITSRPRPFLLSLLIHAHCGAVTIALLWKALLAAAPNSSSLVPPRSKSLPTERPTDRQVVARYQLQADNSRQPTADSSGKSIIVAVGESGWASPGRDRGQMVD